MAETIGLRAVIDLKNFNKGMSSYNKGIDQMNKETSGFTSRATKSLGSLGGNLLKFGAIAGGAALAGVVALGAGLATFAIGGIKQAIALEQQMADIAAIMGKTVEEVQPLKDLILELAINPNLKVSATEAAEAVELLARNGVSATDIIGGMAEGTVALANATGADFATAADLATDVMALFSDQGVSMTNVIDGITGVTTSSKFSVDDYRLAFANFGPVAAAIGIELEDVNTLIAGTAQNFDSGSIAGAAFRTIFLKLSAPTTEQAALMDKFGISMFTAEGEMRAMSDITQQFNNVLQGQATITTTAGGATNQMIAAAERARKAMPALTNTIAEQGGDLAILQNELGAVTDMYGVGSPAVDKHKQKILKLTNSMGENQAKLQEQRAAVAGVTNARIEASTVTRELTEEEKANFSAVLGGARGSVALTALAGLQTDEFEKLSLSVNENGQAMKAAATRVDSVQGAFEIFKSIISGVQIQIGDRFLPIIKELLVQFSTLAADQGPKVIAFFEVVADVVGKAISWVSGFVVTVQDLIATFQAGGLFGTQDPSGGGQQGLLAALGIPPDFIAIIEDVFNGISDVITSFSEGDIGGGLLGILAVDVTILQGIVDTIAQFLAENWPIVQAQLMLWGNQFFDWVNTTVVPAIPEALSAIIMGITAFLAEQVPVIQASTQEWVTGFWEWVQGVISSASESLAGIIAVIGLWAASPETQTQLTAMGVALGEALVIGIQNLVENQAQIVSILTQIVTGLAIGVVAVVGLLAAIGGQILAGIITGILESVGLVGSEFQPILISELATMGMQLLFIAQVVGLDIMLGIIGGLEDGISQLITTITQIGTIISETVKSALGISSPSTLFFGFGIDIIQGLIDGIISLAASLPDILSNLFQGAGDIFGSLFGGGGDEAEGPAISPLAFDPTEMLEGIESVNLGIAGIDLALNNITLITLPLLTEMFLVTTTLLIEQLLLLLTTGIMPVNLALVLMTTVTLPALQAMVIAVAAASIAALTPVEALLQVLVALMNDLKAATEAWGKAIAAAAKIAIKGFTQAAKAMKNQLIPAMKNAVRVAVELAAALRAVAVAARSASKTSKSKTGTGFAQGIGFQAGTPSNTSGLLGLGFKIPSGFQNDSFGPLFAQTGEEMLITPKGTSIEGLIFSRLANLLRGTAVQGGSVINNIVNNFQMNVQTSSTPQAVTRQFEVMQGFVGT